MAVSDCYGRERAVQDCEDHTDAVRDFCNHYKVFGVFRAIDASEDLTHGKAVVWSNRQHVSWKWQGGEVCVPKPEPNTVVIATVKVREGIYDVSKIYGRDIRRLVVHDHVEALDEFCHIFGIRGEFTVVAEHKDTLVWFKPDGRQNYVGNFHTIPEPNQ